MKAIVAVILAILSLASSASAQKQPLHDSTLVPIFQGLEARDWEKVHKLANEILAKHDADLSNAVAFTRYAALHSGAALVAEGKMTFEVFEPYAKQFVNKSLITAAHPTSTDTSIKLAINTNKLTTLKDGTVASFVTVTDAERKKIYSQEIVTYSSKFDVTPFHGKNTFTGGYLKSIEINPEKKTNWIMRLTIENANIQIWQGS